MLERFAETYLATPRQQLLFVAFMLWSGLMVGSVVGSLLG